ncbi:MAG: putative toxin-antitoxin system toxin component, PIN family [Cyanobacteria bacterium MAG CAR1_bin_15]|nr:putative toxin-antitoxin system toxin component, PIN family [Cyanobacteria bacterium MAG CAR1_bin_15]
MKSSTLSSANGLLLFSQETFLEFRQRIMRSKFDKYVSRKSRINYIKQLEKISKFVSINGTILGCRDQDDDKFLETAFNGKADFIITGDNDLLEMVSFRNISIVISIVSPKNFLIRFNEIQL